MKKVSRDNLWPFVSADFKLATDVLILWRQQLYLSAHNRKRSASYGDNENPLSHRMKTTGHWWPIQRIDGPFGQWVQIDFGCSPGEQSDHKISTFCLQFIAATFVVRRIYFWSNGSKNPKSIQHIQGKSTIQVYFAFFYTITYTMRGSGIWHTYSETNSYP